MATLPLSILHARGTATITSSHALVQRVAHVSSHPTERSLLTALGAQKKSCIPNTPYGDSQYRRQYRVKACGIAGGHVGGVVYEITPRDPVLTLGG